MANKFSEILYKDILQDEDFQILFNELLILYVETLVNKFSNQYDGRYNKLLRYADILSLSNIEKYQNIAQQIVILLSQVFPDENIIKIFKENVYKNVSNFVSLNLMADKGDLSESQPELLSEIAYNVHRIKNTIPGSDKSFFDTQISVFESLQRNQYYSFSAPTSMGKTFIITKFILSQLKSNTAENFVILVPTRALISEISSNIIHEFKSFIGISKHRVLTTLASLISDEKFIAVLTPERLYYAMLENKRLKFQYLFIDEAHKISSNDKRSILYYKILDMLKQHNDTRIYFSSPGIPNPNIYLKLTNHHLSGSTSLGQSFVFSPVVQNKIYINLMNRELSIYNPVLNEFLKYSSTISCFNNYIDILLDLGKNKCNLIYVASINKAISRAVELQSVIRNNNQINLSDEIQEILESFAKDIEDKIHKDYYLASLVRCGIAYHIGALPSSIRIKIEELLRLGYIKYCFCTSTLIEGVNVPVDNLFILDYKRGSSNLTPIDVFNLIGRAGRVSLNEFGNVFIIINKENIQNHFNKIILRSLPNESLLPSKAITKKTKKNIVECLLKGETNLLDNGKRYEGLTEATYEYAIKCLNMLLYDICINNESYLVKDFIDAGILSKQNIINIRNIFKDYTFEDNDINISIKQKESLFIAIKNRNINYPEDFDYDRCVSFLENLSKVLQWSIYEKKTLGNSKRLRYYAVLLLQWMQGKGLHEIIRKAIKYNKDNLCKIREPQNNDLVIFNNTEAHKNILINDIMKDIDIIINYKLSMYFLRFSETYLKCYQQPLVNDWYEYVEYGTSDKQVITLQKHGFLREEAITLNTQFRQYILLEEGNLRINSNILDKVSPELKNSIETVMINYPEIF